MEDRFWTVIAQKVMKIESLLWNNFEDNFTLYKKAYYAFRDKSNSFRVNVLKLNSSTDWAWCQIFNINWETNRSIEKHMWSFFVENGIIFNFVPEWTLYLY